MKGDKSIFEPKGIDGISNRKIFDIPHSIDKFNLAGDKDFKNTILWIIKNGIKEIISNHSDERGNYGIHSKSTGIGLVLNWRKDKYDKKRKKLNHAFVITILPIKKKDHLSHVTAEIFIEQIKEWVKQRRGNIIFEESTANIISEDIFHVVFWEGEYYDANLNAIIGVE